MKILALLSIITLTSCSFLDDFAIKGEAAYIFDDGSKARIVSDGTTHSGYYWKKVADSWIKVGTTVETPVTKDK